MAEWRDREAFDETERLALEFAERVTLSDQDVDDALYERLRHRFGEPALVELTVIIGFENFSSKFNHVFHIETQRFCPLPPVRGAADGTS